MEYSRESALKSLTRKANSVQGICETLRLVYDCVYEMPDGETKDRATELLVDAFIMGKKITDRLVYYKKTYNDTTGHNGKNVKGLTGNVERRKMREARYEGV